MTWSQSSRSCCQTRTKPKEEKGNAMLRFLLMLCLACFGTDLAAKPKVVKEDVSKDPIVTSYCEFLTAPIVDRFYVALKDTPLKDSPDESSETIIMIKKGNVLMAKLDDYSDELKPGYSNGYIQLTNVGSAKLDGWASAKFILSVLLFAPLDILESGIFECQENTRKLFARAFGFTNSEMFRHMLNQEKMYMYQMLRVVVKRFGKEAHLEIIRLLERKEPRVRGSSGFTIEDLCPYKLKDPQNIKKPTTTYNPDKDF